ncbi:MAG: nucleoside triphosphate pyrophosphohydrolase [Gammaproteobacteria bacterium]|nr:MAG: nucleoside triphosphate pyrophosphohydrolase [Gammaproteobacteria bacterium]
MSMESLPDPLDETADPVLRLLAVMARLRDPERGCPWDLAQDFRTIVPHTLEEAYEVADTIEREDWAQLPGELGDLLFQVVFYARLAEERGWFDFHAVAAGIVEKLIRRHPHVFGGDRVPDRHGQREAWEGFKEEERRARGQAGLLDDLPRALPALVRALKLQRRAARVGMDWEHVYPVLEKLEEETEELRAAIEAEEPARMRHELGDLLFTLVNLARHLEIDPEQALREANRRFEARLRYMERRLQAEGRTFAETDPEQLDRLWEEAKRKMHHDGAK